MKKRSFYPNVAVLKIGPRKVKTIGDHFIFEKVIKKDTVSDGASVPRFLWWFMNPFGFAFPAALVHDVECSEADTWIDRQVADDRFYNNLIKMGAKTWYAWFAWLGVRIGAWYDLRKK